MAYRYATRQAASFSLAPRRRAWTRTHTRMRMDDAGLAAADPRRAGDAGERVGQVANDRSEQLRLLGATELRDEGFDFAQGHHLCRPAER